MVGTASVTWGCCSLDDSSTSDFTTLQNVAWLVGPENSTIVMSSFIQQNSDPKEDWAGVISMLPIGLSCVGILIPASGERHTLEEAKGLIDSICFQQNGYADILGDGFVAVLWADSNQKTAFHVNGSSKSIEPAPWSEEGAECSKHWLRATYSDKIVVPLPPVSANSSKALSKIVSSEVQAVLERLEGSPSVFALMPDYSMWDVKGGEVASNSGSRITTVESLIGANGGSAGWTLKRCTGGSSSGSGKGKGKGKGKKGKGKGGKSGKKTKTQNISLADPLQGATTMLPCGQIVTVPLRSTGGAVATPTAGVLVGDLPAGTTFTSFSVKADVVAHAPLGSLVSEILKNGVFPEVKRQLQACGELCLAAISGDIASTGIKVNYFSPVKSITHPLVLPPNVSANPAAREKLHDRLSLHLPKNRPQFKLACAATFNGEESQDAGNNDEDPDVEKLMNVHEGLDDPTKKSQSVEGGKIYTVFGKYRYFHYMQNRYDDKGWGCAYRSLQTIVSWYRMNHYTDILVPSHRDIQQTLVECGEKKRSFVGSKDWIGSQEVGRFLEHRIPGLAFKIIFIRSGEELNDIARTVATHFKTQGTPIMIGGEQPGVHHSRRGLE